MEPPGYASVSECNTSFYDDVRVQRKTVQTTVAKNSFYLPYHASYVKHNTYIEIQ